MNNSNTIEDLDFTWIDDFEKIDKEYKHYYTEELTFIKVNSIYVNRNNDIEKLREEQFLLKTPGFLQKEELIGIIKHNSFLNQMKYSVLSILKFNLNIEPVHLKTFLRTKNANVGGLFLQSVKNIDTIKFEKSISMFHDINELFIIFHEKIYNPNTNSDINHHNSSLCRSTKKIFIHSNTNKNTKRKPFKELLL